MVGVSITLCNADVALTPIAGTDVDSTTLPTLVLATTDGVRMDTVDGVELSVVVARTPPSAALPSCVCVTDPSADVATVAVIGSVGVLMTLWGDDVPTSPDVVSALFGISTPLALVAMTDVNASVVVVVSDPNALVATTPASAALPSCACVTEPRLVVPTVVVNGTVDAIVAVVIAIVAALPLSAALPSCA